ncbi:MAG: triose-phosphate isomerase [Chitinophagaceae bacterium]|nr:triose-phosphate isomerase [Chitinophagaceae bacterium]
MRKFIAAANWKMNCTKEQAKTLVEDLLAISHTLDKRHLVVLGVPFPYLIMVKDLVGQNNEFFSVAAQNLHHKVSGAFTGEVSAPMLASIGVEYVIIGHSERREQFGEDGALLKQKVDIALEYGLKPIFCCGEPLEVREAGNEQEYVRRQLHESLFHLTAEQMKHVVIAYEPIWAIGTGKTATVQQAQDMHFHLRAMLIKQYDENVANTISILYGGSVKADNAESLFNCPSVDGGLVGGASLIAADFEKIIEGLKR